MKIKGEFLTSLRKKLKLSRNQVARLVGYSPYAIFSIEKKGKSTAEIELLARLSILYNVELDELINWDKIKEDYVLMKILDIKHNPITSGQVDP